MTQKELIYLACPYSDENPKVMQFRYAVSASIAADLFKAGKKVFAASMHNALIETISEMRDRFTTWQSFNHLMIERSDRMYVIKMPGWEQSKGVQDQIEYAKSINRPVDMIEPPKAMLENIWETICRGDAPLLYPA